MAFDKKIAFLGGGNMAEALIKGLISTGMAMPHQIHVTDIAPERHEHHKKTHGVVMQQENAHAAREADVIVLSVKPKVIATVLEEISPVIDRTKLVISIAAGITTASIEKALAADARVVRVMPNTPSLVLAGAAAIAGGKHAASDDLALAQHIFASVGKAVIVEEKLMDLVTGLSGSGPAYVFVIIDALAEAGVHGGLSHSLALELAAQTVYGAAKMVLETKGHPAALKDKVASPGGTTVEGLRVLEQANLRAILMQAVEAAAARSKELGKQH